MLSLFRFFAILILVYLLVRFFRILFTGRRRNNDHFEQTHTDSNKSRSKIIQDDEGEYVDFEDVDND